MASSLSISTPLKPSFLPRSSFLKPQTKPASIRFKASVSSSPFLTALETPAHETSAYDAVDMLLGERVVFVCGEINDYDAENTLSELMLLDARDQSKEIRIYINSPGGSLSATLVIYDAIQMIKSPVSTIAFGKVTSTAALILGAGSPGRRFALPHARIMLNQPSGSASGPVRAVEFHAVELLENKNNFMRIVSEFTGRPISQVKKDLYKDYYMSPSEAVKYGVIDKVLDEDKTIPIQPMTGKLKSKPNVPKDLKKYLSPEIPDNEIY